MIGGQQGRDSFLFNLLLIRRCYTQALASVIHELELNNLSLVTK